MLPLKTGGRVRGHRQPRSVRRPRRRAITSRAGRCFDYSYWLTAGRRHNVEPASVAAGPECDVAAVRRPTRILIGTSVVGRTIDGLPTIRLRHPDVPVS